MHSFINDRKHLIQKYKDWRNVKIIEVSSQKILSIPNAGLLAGFWGYLKYQLAREGRSVFCRGEQNFHKTTIPKLFRGDKINEDELKRRKFVFEELCSKVPSWYDAGRFRREDIGPLLQHYGIKTYWLDLVDNIFTASWFAIFNNKSENGYIKFFVDKTDDSEPLNIVDLRKNHSSLSLRLHCQHGLSATWHDVSSSISESIDFSNYMVAHVQIPTNIRKTISIQRRYMFPDKEHDNTLKYFKKDKFSTNLNRILVKNGLPENFLGKIE
jgi:hypothetical protein